MTSPNHEALALRAKEAAAQVVALDDLVALDLDTERQALGTAEARLAKITVRLAKAREDRAEAAEAVSEAEQAIRAKVAPVLIAGGISVAWAAQVLGLRPALCVAKSPNEPTKHDHTGTVRSPLAHRDDVTDTPSAPGPF